MLTENAEIDAIKKLQQGPDHYLLTEVAYPVVVNGKKYTDAKNPILNYEGSTYIPLAKIGELTGVNYKWNAGLKQVEIVSAPAASSDVSAPSDDSFKDFLEELEKSGNVYH
ncbi:stalk domain-containing protein [Paenibacillus donghaensis]|nr:stalk domain-containing protein [Paenibacillus donghaensis]